jgi:hypothetical protein
LHIIPGQKSKLFELRTWLRDSGKLFNERAGDGEADAQMELNYKEDLSISTQSQQPIGARGLTTPVTRIYTNRVRALPHKLTRYTREKNYKVNKTLGLIKPNHGS